METKHNLLIVEDEKAISNLIATTLETQGYHYEKASNGAQAMLAVTSHSPEVILLDLGLPDMDGLDIIRKVRSWSSVPIIVISARTEDQDKIEALDAGADDYLTKPFSVCLLYTSSRKPLRKDGARLRRIPCGRQNRMWKRIKSLPLIKRIRLPVFLRQSW